MKLKTIMENAGIAGYGNQNEEEGPQPMTAEEKRELLEMVEKFNEVGKSLYDYGNPRETADKLSKVAELAERYALEATDADVLQLGEVQKTMTEIKKHTKEMRKIAHEAWEANERLKHKYEMVGRMLEMYYELK
jgi:hypothetical protein